MGVWWSPSNPFLKGKHGDRARRGVLTHGSRTQRTWSDLDGRTPHSPTTFHDPLRVKTKTDTEVTHHENPFRKTPRQRGKGPRPFTRNATVPGGAPDPTSLDHDGYSTTKTDTPRVHTSPPETRSVEGKQSRHRVGLTLGDDPEVGVPRHRRRTYPPGTTGRSSGLLGKRVETGESRD